MTLVIVANIMAEGENAVISIANGNNEYTTKEALYKRENIYKANKEKTRKEIWSTKNFYWDIHTKENEHNT